MNTPHWTDRLSEYLDGDLASPEREACEAHLGTCAECARLLEELKSVVASAGALPLAPPPAELWRGIEARLETPVLQMRPRAELRERLTRRFSLSGWQLAAAAAVVVALTAGVMWFTTRGVVTPASTGAVAVVPEHVPATTASPVTPATPVGGDSIESGPEAASPVPGRERETPAPDARTAPVRGTRTAAQLARYADHGAPAMAADFGVGRYDAAIAELETALASRRSELDSSTVRIVANNLAIIDKAIAEARTALAADPSNRYLNTYLASTMRRKVDMLRRVNSLARI